MASSQYLPSAAAVLAPVHLLSYSSLLGMQLWQSFAVTKITHKALPKSAFTTLSKRIFRVYFLSQAALVLITASTAVPPQSPSSSTSSTRTWFITFAVMTVSSVLNLLLCEPQARQAMIDRTHQETRDGLNKTGPPPPHNSDLLDLPTAEMQAANRRFRRTHFMCMHLNLVTLGATLFWGWKLSRALAVAI
ncbi:hypothetical protein Micbo1qcDRAFT_225112 [Microdochium bolleyi]|uniref:TMEM205-like domain-containing protein n=1 Tax=Microdochium bolleyi TaxID=196109 RepID=A0A136J2G8_9PEZI|nr:hypothetical protein Micbo1qcDRAFT_225112 [Microdochium bolleyi]